MRPLSTSCSRVFSCVMQSSCRYWLRCTPLCRGARRAGAVRKGARFHPDDGSGSYNSLFQPVFRTLPPQSDKQSETASNPSRNSLSNISLNGRLPPKDVRIDFRIWNESRPLLIFLTPQKSNDEPTQDPPSRRPPSI